jgi:hypothetical protein
MPITTETIEQPADDLTIVPIDTTAPRKRKHTAHKSPLGDGSIKLDVFAMFLRSPSKLLYSPSKASDLKQKGDSSEDEPKPRRRKTQCTEVIAGDMDDLTEDEQHWVRVLRLPVERYLVY